MKLPHPFVQLPILFDASRMEAEISALGEDAWLPHPQGFPGNSMLPLVASHGDPANESFAGLMQPTIHLQRCPYVRDVIASLDVIVGRTRLMRLSGHAEVTRHADQGYYWADRVRVHVPVVTQATVRFECGDAHTHMAAGECWIFDTWRQHRVLNDDTRSRIHLVIDTVGSESFWQLVGAGRTADGPAPGASWSPRQVAPDAGSAAPMRFESANIPVVMTPWELADRLRFLLDEAVPVPELHQARALSERFLRRWRFLWAEWGDHEDGWPLFRATAEQYLHDMMGAAGEVPLRNELGLVGALSSLVPRMAVAGPLARPRPGGSAASPPSLPAMAGRFAFAGGPGTGPGAAHHTHRGGSTAAPVTEAPPEWRASRATGPRPQERDPVFDRPVFIVSSPRSGSTMLFEAMATASDVYTIGGESHGLIEGIPALHPGARGFDSNRLDAAAAVPGIQAALRQRFHGALRDRAGRAPAPGRMRMLEKTPKNSLRIPFLASVFPESVFIYLHRDPRAVMGSMIDAWNSGRFRTYPELPGWEGLPWSLLLTPGWRGLAGRPLADIVASQWATTTRIMLDDLEALPPGRVFTARYERLVSDPQTELATLCGAVGLTWDREIRGALPLARHTVSEPGAEKWRRHEAEILPRLPGIHAIVERAASFAGTAG